MIDGRDVTALPAALRNLSMVFQSYALFPHLGVAENVIFGLKVRRVDRKVRAQLAAMFSIDADDLIEQDLIVPFEDVIETDAERAWLDGFHPALMASSEIEGQTWGVPFQRSTIVAYYNKDMFREAGLSPETAPETRDEMVGMGKALSTEDHHGLTIPSTGYP